MRTDTDIDLALELSELCVFVYGTLKPGGRYHQRYCHHVSEAVPAIAKGQLYDFPQWGYPAMTSGNDWVSGYLLTFRQSAATCVDILRRLDMLEGYSENAQAADNEYQRYSKQIYDGAYQPLQTAWIYQMMRDRVIEYGGIYLPSGNWPAQR